MKDAIFFSFHLITERNVFFPQMIRFPRRPQSSGPFWISWYHLNWKKSNSGACQTVGAPHICGDSDVDKESKGESFCHLPRSILFLPDAAHLMGCDAFAHLPPRKNSFMAFCWFASFFLCWRKWSRSTCQQPSARVSSLQWGFPLVLDVLVSDTDEPPLYRHWLSKFTLKQTNK